MKPHTKTVFDTERESLAERIVTGLTKVGLALKFHTEQASGKRGLSPTQAHILTMVALANKGLRPSELAERLAVSAPTVTDSLKALAAKGLIERRADQGDARVNLVVLTAKGRAEGRAAAGWPDFLVNVVDALGPAEQSAFYQGLVKMIGALQADARIPLTGMCVSCVHFRPYVHRDDHRPHHCAFVDAPMRAQNLRLECADHQLADDAQRLSTWDTFSAT